MNDKNQKLLFSDSDEETVVITLTDEDGQDIDAEIKRMSYTISEAINLAFCG